MVTSSATGGRYVHNGPCTDWHWWEGSKSDKLINNLSKGAASIRPSHTRETMHKQEGLTEKNKAFESSLVW